MSITEIKINSIVHIHFWMTIFKTIENNVRFIGFILSLVVIGCRGIVRDLWAQRSLSLWGAFSGISWDLFLHNVSRNAVGELMLTKLLKVCRRNFQITTISFLSALPIKVWPSSHWYVLFCKFKKNKTFAQG